MINAVANIKQMSWDWSGWLLGLWGAFITAAAGAGSAALGTMVVDPNDFNLHNGLRKLLEVTALTALIPGVVSLLKFLQMHPTPDRLQAALANAAAASVATVEAVKTAQKATDVPKG